MITFGTRQFSTTSTGAQSANIISERAELCAKMSHFRHFHTRCPTSVHPIGCHVAWGFVQVWPRIFLWRSLSPGLPLAVIYASPPSMPKNLSAARRLSDWCVGSYYGNVEIRCSKSLKVKAVRGYSGICECIFTKRKIKIKKSQTYKTVHMVDPESSASTSYFKAIRQKETFFWHLNSPLFGNHFVTVFFNIIIVAILP